jgi:hypothetical protein
MRWFNFLGMGLLAFGLVLNEWVVAILSEGFNLFVALLAAAYLILAIWLSIWGGRPSAED